MKRTPLQLTDITELEAAIIKKMATASYPPATASKRFVRDLHAGYIKQLSERGRAFLAFVAHRFRRQYNLTSEEWAWVDAHRAGSFPMPVAIAGDGDYRQRWFSRTVCVSEWVFDASNPRF